MGNIRLYLKANEKIFLNGAVLQVDRKVAFELLNDATFLLENHVMQKEDANTPIKQLYFVVQLMMIHPNDKEQATLLFNQMIRNLSATLQTKALVEGVEQVKQEVENGKEFNALKIIRGLFPIEEEVMSKGSDPEHELQKISDAVSKFEELQATGS